MSAELTGKIPAVLGDLRALLIVTPVVGALLLLGFSSAASADLDPNGDRIAGPLMAPERNYEMVTPPVKNNRLGDDGRTGSAQSMGRYPDFRLPVPGAEHGEQREIDPLFASGLASADGRRYLVGSFAQFADPATNYGVAADSNFTVYERASNGWNGQAVLNAPPRGSASSRLATRGRFALDQDISTIAGAHYISPFPFGDLNFTWLAGDHNGVNGSGMYSFIPPDAPASFRSAWQQADPATDLFDWPSKLSADGGVLVRNSGLVGLLGAEDPALQVPHNSGTMATGAFKRIVPYVATPPAAGATELLFECSGELGVDATQVVQREGSGQPTDTVGVRECVEGEITSPMGAAPGVGRGQSLPGAISKDGSRIFFTSPDVGESVGSGLQQTTAGCRPATGPDTHCQPQLFLRQVDGDGQRVVRWISRPDAAVGEQQIGLLGRGAFFEGASEDGSKVFFRTTAPLTADDPNGESLDGADPRPITTGVASDLSWDLYRYELPKNPQADPADGELTRISAGPTGEADASTTANYGNPNSVVPHGPAARFISDDGSRVLFTTTSPLEGVSPSPPDGASASLAPGGTEGNTQNVNLYMYDERRSNGEQYRFVAQLPAAAPGASGVDACATTAPVPALSFHGATPSAIASNCMRGSESGDVVAFQTSAQLVDEDLDNAVDIYVYDVNQHSLLRVTGSGQDEPYACQIAGEIEACNAIWGYIAGSGPVSDEPHPSSQRNLTVDDKGDFQSLYFETAHSLVPEDANERFDVYEWSKADGLVLISPADPQHHSFYAGNSLDGEDVFFSTQAPIDPREVDPSDVDIYDARVGGGFPYEEPGEGCAVMEGQCEERGSSSSSPGAPSSAIYEGSGNVAERARSSCERPGRKVRRLSKRARRLRAKAKRAAKPARAKRIHRKAMRSKKRAKHLRRSFRRCEAKNREMNSDEGSAR